MDINCLIFEPRPRKPWQAVDVGILVARRWWLVLVLLWLIPVIPFYILLTLIIPVEYLWLQLLIIWWFKPLYEKPLLYFLSYAVFDQVYSMSDIVKKMPNIMFRQFFSECFFRRLSFSRSMNMPVVVLENLSGHLRQERLKMLHLRESKPASWITFWSVHIEFFLYCSIFILLYMFVPKQFIQELSITEIFLDDTYAVWLGYIANMVYVFCYAAIAPFYVAGGFLLYLNRRISLEGWDIEMSFKAIISKNSVAQNKSLGKNIDGNLSGSLEK